MSPDARKFAVGVGRSVRVWDVTTGDELRPFKGHSGIVWSAAFSPDGTRLATGSSDGNVRIWDVTTREPLITLDASPGIVHAVAFSPDGNTLVSTSETENVVKFWRATPFPDSAQ
jgi:WD40 repeat protein